MGLFLASVDVLVSVPPSGREVHTRCRRLRRRRLVLRGVGCFEARFNLLKDSAHIGSQCCTASFAASLVPLSVHARGPGIADVRLSLGKKLYHLGYALLFREGLRG